MTNTGALVDLNHRKCALNRVCLYTNSPTVLYKVLRYCVLNIASFILLLHSFVPHQHHIQDSLITSIEICSHSENSLLGFLGEVFHMDLGSEHLENFKPVSKVEFTVMIPLLIPEP